MTDTRAEAWDGRPENPERDGWHWLCAAVGIGAPYPMLWSADGKAWDTGDGWVFCTDPALTERQRYLGPCLLPEEVAALVAAARREGAEAMRGDAAKVAALWPTGITTEAQEQLAAAIRALPLPGDEKESGDD